MKNKPDNSGPGFGEESDCNDLEKTLRGLKPSGLKDDFLSELARDYRNTTGDSEKDHEVTPIPWRRLAPLAAAACLVTGGYVYVQYSEQLTRNLASSESSNTSEEKAISAPVDEGLTASRLVPVSAQGYLIDASSGGVRDSENGPVEEMNFEYQDAYHWQDPTTGTNIRIFTPRQEQVLIPLPTN